MGGMQEGMELWAIVPELTLVGVLLDWAGWLPPGWGRCLRTESPGDPRHVNVLAVYLFMNLGSFLAVDAIERQLKTDEIREFAGLGRRLPLSSAVLAIGMLALAGFPPFGSFVGKTMLFGAVFAAGWTWLAMVMLANIALSLYYYVRVLVPLYLRPSTGNRLQREPAGLRIALLLLALERWSVEYYPRYG